MRILFDRNVPATLGRFLTEHQVETTTQHGWSTLRNGDLLTSAENAGFDLLVTGDQNIAYQQNFKDRRIGLVVLGAGNWPIVRNYVSAIIAAISAAGHNTYAFVEMPLMPKQESRPRFER